MEKIILKDYSGNKYNFFKYKIDEIEDYFNEETICLYFYSKKDDDDNWEYIYLGETIQLTTRHNQHLNKENETDECIMSYNPTHLFVHEIDEDEDDAETRTQIEQELIENYDWICNIQHNS